MKKVALLIIDNNVTHKSDCKRLLCKSAKLLLLKLSVHSKYNISMKQLFTSLVLIGLTAVVAFGQPGKPIDETFFEKGMSFLDQKKFRDAADEFDHAVAVNPQPKYYNQKGLALMFARDFAKAADAYENSILLQPDNPDAYKGLVNCYKAMKDNDRLVATWDGMSKNLSDVKERLAAKANVINFMIRRREYDVARTHAVEAVQISPNDVETLQLYARVNNLLGNYEEARSSAQKAANNLATSEVGLVSNVFYELGYAAHFLGDFKTKNMAFEKVKGDSFRPLMAKLTPEYFTSLAYAFDAIFEYDEAEKQLSEAFGVDEHYPDANKMQAVISGHRNPAHEKIAFYKKAITGILKQKESDNTGKYDQELMEDYAGLIELKINSGEYPAAIAAASECMDIFAQQPLALDRVKFFKAIALNRENKTDEAIALLTELSSSDERNANRNPTDFLSYNFALGYLQYQTKDYEKAKQALARARRGQFANAAQHIYERIMEEADDARNVTATNADDDTEK